jgi:hypothetical protein
MGTCTTFCTAPSALCTAPSAFCTATSAFDNSILIWVLMQASQDRYGYKRQDTGTPFSGSYSQLLTGHNNSSMVLVSVKNQSERDSHDAEGSMHGGSGGFDALEGTPAGGGSAAPEPYQILMPVQMADGQMMALPADQAQVSFAIQTYSALGAYAVRWQTVTSLITC